MKNPTVSSTISHSSVPIQVLVNKEIAYHIRSWRFIILILLIVLTFGASLYVSSTGLKEAVNNMKDPDQSFLYLKLLTTTDNSIPPFHVFLNFLAPLLGIALGFDAINAEYNGGTLTRLIAQPIYRDNLLFSKFFAPLTVVGTMFIALVLLMIGGGLLGTGVRIEPQELLRIIGFTLISVIYVAFWLSLSILLSIRFRQPATSALTAIGIWLFFTVFFPILVNLAIRPFLPNPNYISEQEYLSYNELILNLLRLSPSQLYMDATTTLLMPSVRSLGPIAMEQMIGAIPAPLSFRDSFLMVWPQVSGLLAATMICFAWSYYIFMRREIRS
ncbi:MULTISPECIES: ABC transporter permease [Sphingobacterium]|jgi:ABC-2 type transport system permease protein|uniref:ABC transporter permease n=1 Tax=Sphingobacterium TaxID=28453 RepID=UPI0004E5F87B|nr:MULTISPECIES: ABC transporter permease subunit [Sphingobacterium]CDS92054.1 ABC transporter permease protein [Sphingobacterium sp. PM2-P1-29]SJN49713.1 ABC-type transport, permease protein [Sphingobacterium faecium PCAi_F2.5]HCU43927.1 ABC transporter permease [Sphingobacterium sp.]UPZ36875.1 ABC transporter permease [Sphingobacterium sp. PCS056]UXD68400.1 ABC transporter permease [Sphingobacterium faecium]